MDCNTRLLPTHNTEQELKLLRTAVIDKVLARDDIYETTSPLELRRFLTMLEARPRYDIVIDGLNVALTRLPGMPKLKPIGLASANLASTVNFFHQQGKRILVIHRPVIKKYPHYAQLMELSSIQILDGLTQDDPYFIIAALHSGQDCKFITNDHLRQHLHLLWTEDPGIAKLFNRWQISHQIYVKGFDKVKNSYTGKPGLVFPPNHNVEPCKAGNNWHIPVFKTALQQNVHEAKTVYFGRTARWICAGATNKAKTINVRSLFGTNTPIGGAKAKPTSSPATNPGYATTAAKSGQFQSNPLRSSEDIKKRDTRRRTNETKSKTKRKP